MVQYNCKKRKLNKKDNLESVHKKNLTKNFLNKANHCDTILALLAFLDRNKKKDKARMELEISSFAPALHARNVSISTKSEGKTVSCSQSIRSY